MRNKLIVWTCLEKKERGNVSMKSRYNNNNNNNKRIRENEKR